MKRIYSLHKARRLAATIGVFDGVHLGHQKILNKLVKEAKIERRKSLVITFHPHPRSVLSSASRIPLLTSLEHRLRLIKGLGVDFVLVIRFTKEMSQIEARDFIGRILMRRLDIKDLVIGENFLFGYKGEGDLRLLKRMGKEYGFRLFAVKPVRVKGAIVSSTKIRRSIEKGDFKNASRMLGRPVTILGTVVRGRSIGRKLGFPTANINPHHETIPPSGVYAVDVRLNKKIYRAILNIGTRPTFARDIEPTIELHIFNFKKNIYGKDAEIRFKKKIRDERRFPSIEALRRQIKKDILRAR